MKGQSGEMSNTYRAYLLDARNRIIRPEVLDASADDEALAAAAAFTAENDVEVWRGDRLIARIAQGGEVSAVRPDDAKPA